MNYRWKVKYYLKTGPILTGVYIGPEKSTNDVANKIIAGDGNEFTPVYADSKETSALLVRKGEIVAAEISAN